MLNVIILSYWIVAAFALQSERQLNGAVVRLSTDYEESVGKKIQKLIINPDLNALTKEYMNMTFYIIIATDKGKVYTLNPKSMSSPIVPMADNVGIVHDVKFDYQERLMFFSTSDSVYYVPFAPKKSQQTMNSQREEQVYFTQEQPKKLIYSGGSISSIALNTLSRTLYIYDLSLNQILQMDYTSLIKANQAIPNGSYTNVDFNVVKMLATSITPVNISNSNTSVSSIHGLTTDTYNKLFWSNQDKATNLGSLFQLNIYADTQRAQQLSDMGSSLPTKIVYYNSSLYYLADQKKLYVLPLESMELNELQPILLYDQFKETQQLAVFQNKIIVLDEVMGLVMFTLDDNGTSVISGPKYISLPLINENIVGFGVIVLSGMMMKAMYGMMMLVAISVFIV